MGIGTRLADRFQRWRTKSRPRSAPADGLLLLSAGGLGDTILFAHVIEQFCRYARPDEPVTVLLRKDGAKTAFLFPPSVQTMVVDFDRFRKSPSYRMAVSNSLYDAHYRSVISTDYLRHPELDETMMRAAKAPETIAMTARPWPKYQDQLDRNAQAFTKLFDSGPALQDKLLRWFRFANWLTGDTVKPALRLAPPLSLTSTSEAAPLVLIQPFSAVKAKQSAPEIYEALLDALPVEADVRITGASGEMAANPAYKGLLGRPNVRFDDATFQDLLPMLQRARLVVSVDTAVLHLSVAAGAPTLCLASAAYVGEIVPYAPELCPAYVDFYYKPMSCEGCLGDCIHPLQNGAYRCVAELETETVVAKALGLFEGA